MIKYGEMTTKKNNIQYFIDKLLKSINIKLKPYNISITKNKSRMYIFYDNKHESIIIQNLKNIPGMHSFVICEKISTDFEKIKECALNLIKKEKFKTFKVETKRAYKNFFYDSMKVSELVGEYILDNIANISVDVHNPQIILNIEIRNANETYIYTNEVKGLGGYPCGIQGKGLLMLSGGIDSPVAGFYSIKKGIDIDCVYFEALPHTSIQARNKVIELTKILKKYNTNINLYIVPFTKIQEAIYKNIDNTYMITIMRRMMYRIASEFSKKINADIIINGESIGQVASQTLKSINVVNEVTNIPIIRPLACLDKLDIIKISKDIGAYDISIMPYEDCCTIFVPKHPIIYPSLDKCLLYESYINYNELINDAINNILKIDIDKINSEYNKLL